MNNIQLSIIIPVYNVEDYLAECLDSVFIQQDLAGCEVICVNDGSTDSSREILAKYKQRYPELIIIDQKNGGLPAARNSGLRIAEGEYVFFLDSDDYLLQHCIKKMITFVTYNDLDLALYNSINSTGKLYYNTKEEINIITDGISFFSIFFSLNTFFPPSVQWLYLYKRNSIIEHNMFFPEDNLQEDEPYTVKAFFYAKKVGCLNEVVVYHRVYRPGSITQRASLPHLIDAKDAWQKLYIYLKKNKCKCKSFYRKIFYLYQNTITKISSEQFSDYKDGFWSKNDFRTMRKCAVDSELYKYYWYFRFNNKMHFWYLYGKRFEILKIFFNRLIALNYKFIKHE